MTTCTAFENCVTKPLHYKFFFRNDDVAILRELFMKDDGMTPILEEKHGFKLIIHQRDFMPGTLILANISEAILKTRRMIMLFSRY